MPGLAASAPVAQQLKTPGSSECVEDPSLDPAKNTEECKPEGNSCFIRQTLEVHARVQVGEYSRTGAVPCRNCPKGYVTDGSGATTCVKDSGSSSEEDKKKDCPKGTKYVTEDKYGSGCRPECRPGSYSSTGLYPCTRCKSGTYTKESGATACTDYPKECSEGSKLITEGTTSKCARECAEGLLLRDWRLPLQGLRARLHYHGARRHGVHEV